MRSIILIICGGAESMTDLSILLLTMHVSFQILLPKYTKLGREGLYCIRRWIVAVAVILPAVNALIPFARYPSNTAYAYDGAYCSLFTGPLWYNLSLSWVPRYTIWLFILIVLVTLWAYIRSQTYTVNASVRTTATEKTRRKLKVQKARLSSCFGAAQRRLSIGGSTGSRKLAAQAMGANIAPWTVEPQADDHVQPLESFTVESRNPRKQAQRLMLYPLLYIFAWSIPFSAQCVAYTRTHTVNGVFALRAASVFCVSLLGCLDVIVFCWRERPWQHVGNRGGIFNSVHIEPSFGSRRSSAEPNPGLEEDATIQRPIKAQKVHGKGSDRERRSVQLAYDRLALEQADAMAQNKTARPLVDREVMLLPDISGESL